MEASESFETEVEAENFIQHHELQHNVDSLADQPIPKRSSADVNELESEKFNATTVHAQYDSIMKGLVMMMNCNEKNCDVDIHRRHHEFVGMPLLVFQREKRRHMFGSKHFDEEVMGSVLQRMIGELLLTKPDKRYPATGLPISFIKGLQDTSSLLKIFEYRKQMAMYYLRYVLLKQYLVNMLAKLTGNECKWADSECIETEVDMMEIIRQSRINQK